MSNENVGFEVTDEVQVGDLSAVQTQILPVAQNVKVRVVKASVDSSKDKALKTLKVELKIVDGIPVGDEMKYINKSIFPGFMDLCVWADPAIKTSAWYQSKQHLLGFKTFCQALDIDVKDVKINDEFLSSLIGLELTVNIGHEEETVVGEDGKRVKTGTLRERIRGFRKVV